jgi:eukaryotic-like serine/threonine-protein kinase
MSSPVDRAAEYGLLSQAFELPLDARAAFLRVSCGDFPELHRRLTRMLALADGGETIGGLSIAEHGAAGPERVGREYGPFRLVERLGIGGMGAVYRAERIDEVPQTVAIKVLHGEVNAANQAQFLREARILARLEHPFIAHLIDVGVAHAEGWIAMEFVRGLRITDYCDARNVDVAARVRLLAAVADAIVIAHRALIVHRDIKPSNVLVTAEGRPKLIDFGIAYALARPAETREATTDIRRLFTPHYAAPEQVLGEPVTVATDVFGLGALGYRLLTGVEAFAKADSAVGYLLAVTQDDIGLPSEAARAAGSRPEIVRRLRGDLDCILTKALARQPAHRYATVDELQSDLRAYLEGRPVAARPRSVTYRLAKYARRHALALCIATVLALAFGSAGVLYIVQEERVGNAQAAAARRDEFLEGMLKAANPYGGQRDVTVASLLDRASLQLDRELKSEPLVEASMLGLIARTNLGLGRFHEGHAANDRQLEILQRSGAGALERGRALALRGELFRYESRWAESAAALNEAVRLLEPLGASAELCAALDNLGAAQLNLQQLSTAEANFRHELAIEASAAPRLDRERVTADLSISAMLGAELGRYPEALSFATDGWQLAQKRLPLDDPERINMEDGYAVALRNTAHQVEAEPIFRDVIARLTRSLGPEHHDTLVAEIGLVNDLLDLHRYEEAADTALSAAHSVESTLGPDSWFALQAWDKYGVAMCNDKDGAAGLASLEHVAQVERRTLAPGHRVIYSVELDLGNCLARLGRFAEAETTLLDAARGLERSRGSTHRLTQQAYVALRNLYAAMDHPEDSRSWGQKVTP